MKDLTLSDGYAHWLLPVVQLNETQAVPLPAVAPPSCFYVHVRHVSKMYKIRDTDGMMMFRQSHTNTPHFYVNKMFDMFYLNLFTTSNDKSIKKINWLYKKNWTNRRRFPCFQSLCGRAGTRPPADSGCRLSVFWVVDQKTHLLTANC